MPEDGTRMKVWLEIVLPITVYEYEANQEVYHPDGDLTKICLPMDWMNVTDKINDGYIITETLLRVISSDIPIDEDHPVEA